MHAAREARHKASIHSSGSQNEKQANTVTTVIHSTYPVNHHLCRLHPLVNCAGLEYHITITSTSGSLHRQGSQRTINEREAGAPHLVV